MSGPNLPGSRTQPNNQLLAIGVCVYDVTDGDKPDLVLKGEEVCILKLPPQETFEKRCWDEFWTKSGKGAFDWLVSHQNEALTEKWAANWVVDIVRKYSEIGIKLVMCSDHPAFDFAWIDNLVCRHFDILPISGYRMTTTHAAPLDLKSASEAILASRGRTSPHWNWWKFSTFLAVKHDHNPGHDARSMLERYLLLRYLL